MLVAAAVAVPADTDASTAAGAIATDGEAVVTDDADMVADNNDVEADTA